MTKQYLRKREYLGKMHFLYHVRYGSKTVLIEMEWISGEYQITKAKLATFQGKYEDFPYRRSVKTIDRIEELLK